MRSLFHTFLPNGTAGDPVLWVDLLDEGCSILLDLGDLHGLSHRKLLRVDRVVVTHTHMDHFIGFDQLLRVALGREKELVLTGPQGFLDRVRGRIGAYTWNLIRDYPVRIVAEEVDGATVRSELFRGGGEMRPEPLPERPFAGTIEARRAYTLQVASFDHGVPVLGACLRETEHLSVRKSRLTELGLRAGPWLRELKLRVWRRRALEGEVEVPREDGGVSRLGRAELARQLLFRTPGQAIAYLTDLAFTEANLVRARELAEGVDLLVCEAAFLHRDEHLARERHHLTARQAGELARAVGARRLAPFHFSPRYQGRERELLDEAAEAFGGPIALLPPR